MDMPRCRDCRWWGSMTPRILDVDQSPDYIAFHAGAKMCTRVYEPRDSAWMDDGALPEEWNGYVGVLVTRPGFGCVRFEAKD